MSIVNFFTKKLKPLPKDFIRILYQRVDGTCIKWQFTLNIIPQQNDFIWFDNNETYRVAVVDYQFITQTIVITCIRDNKTNVIFSNIE